jgi:hypothetical protein
LPRPRPPATGTDAGTLAARCGGAGVGES